MVWWLGDRIPLQFVLVFHLKPAQHGYTYHPPGTKASAGIAFRVMKVPIPSLHACYSTTLRDDFMLRAIGHNIGGQRHPTLLNVTCCVRLHTLLHVFGSCCAKFETGRTLSYGKIPQISPGAYIFQKPFLRGLFLEGLIFGGAYVQREICVSK